MTVATFRALLTEEVFRNALPRWWWLRVLRMLWRGRGGPGLACLLRSREWLSSHGCRRLADRANLLIERRYGCYISTSARIAPGVKFPHPVGIVIGEGVVVGARAVIYQHVTLGGGRRGDGGSDRYPVLGDDVTVFAGAAVVGKVNVGARTTIGANAVVLSDLPEACTAVGVPARVLRRSSTS
ncbi:MAG TPA: serine acetyltransferase [Ideonella sp.]|uniref:serine O-acetyltransferase n=1 Tax=Ideonella sp. TaxID=1929293 RepID=UPI002B700C16|nr:serine acetyltransferase [Ideonella sp.]HSI50556.1 serine acetyltransferase [Ideonella sp.]